MKRAYHADPENAEWTAQRDPADPRETKTILKKKEKKIPDEPLEDEAAQSTPAAWPHQRAHSYANFHSTSNCWVCGAMPLSVMDGLPWGCHHSAKEILNHSALFWDTIIISPCSLGISQTYSQ